MKLNFEKQYKNREPMETVQIIRDFFSKTPFIIKELDIIGSDAGTWSTRLEAMYDGKQIFSSNGKGLYKDYALASAYAELYERYCNKNFFFLNPIFNNKVIECTKKEKGYYLDPNEKKLNYNDFLAFPLIKNNVKYFENTEGTYYNFLNTIFPMGLIGVPFKSITGKEDIYLDPRVLLTFNSSSGMAAGNTLEEAFIQGASEIVEHYATSEYLNNKIDKYHFIKLETITNPAIQKLIENIRKTGNEIYLCDLSYNFNVPVIMSILINNNMHTASANIGAFPVFDIACERTITELYQGQSSYSNIKEMGMIPFRSNIPIYYEIINPGTVSGKATFIEDMIWNSEYVEVNYDVFLPMGEYSDDDLFNYYKILSNKLNINFYYYDVSKIKEVTAIKIVCDNLHTLTIPFDIGKQVENKDKLLQVVSNLYNLLENIDNKKQYTNNLNMLVNILSKMELFKNNSYEKHQVNILRWCPWGHPYGIATMDLILLIYYLFFGCIDNYYMNQLSTSYDLNKDYLMALILTKRYLMSNKYSVEEVRNIIQFLGLEFNDSFLEIEPYIWFDNIFVKPYQKLANDSKALKLINTLAN